MPVHKHETAPVTSSSEKNHFEERLKGLLSAELTPGTITGYTDVAFEGLLELSEQLRFEHAEAPWTQETEDQTFNEYGLGNIRDILDHIIKIGDSIERAAARAQTISVVDTVFVPADKIAMLSRVAGNRTVERGTILRLQTILFVLENDFAVDISDTSALKAEKGKTLETMVRDDGYVHLNIPGLAKTILVCDEVENATFIFDTAVAEELGIAGDMLRNLTKIQLSNLIASNPSIGSRIVYSATFTKDVKAALGNDMSAKETYSTSSSYLLPSITPDIVTLTHAAESLGIHANTLTKLINELNVLVGKYNTDTGPVSGMPASCLDVLRQVEDVATPQANSYGARSLEELHRTLGVGRITLANICEVNGIRIAKYKFGSRPRGGDGIHGEDLDQLFGLDIFNVPRGSDCNVIGTNEATEILSISHKVLLEAVADLKLNLKEYRFGKHVSRGFQESDLALLRQHEKICIPDAEDYGAVSLRELGSLFDTTIGTMKRKAALADIRVGTFSFNSTPGAGILLDDLESLESALKLFTPSIVSKPRTVETSSGMVSVNQLRLRLDVVTPSVLKAAERQGIAPQPVLVDGRMTIGFTDTEANLIWQDEKMATPNAKEYAAVSFAPIQTALNVTRGQLSAGIKAMGVQVGDFRFGPNYTRGILQEDVKKLADYFTENNISR